MSKLKCIDLFSGCGGMSLGFQKAGIKILCAFDNWQPAIDIYKLNFNHKIYNEDLSNTKRIISILKKKEFDIIVGGPPCQDFSSAGKRDLKGGRADLTYKYSEIICKTLPNWFVMENVEQIKKTQILSNISADFIASGYGLTAIILDSSFCGVPQKRRRFFLIGHMGDNHNQLRNNFRLKLSNSELTVRDYLGSKLNLDYYYRHPRNYNRRAIYSIDEPSATIRGVNRPIPKGYKINSCDPKNVDLNSIRHLSSIERSYLQTFPESFKFSGTKTNVEQAIGNAVPVNLAKFIANGIISYIKSGPVNNGELFINSEFEIPQKVLTKIEI